MDPYVTLRSYLRTQHAHDHLAHLGHPHWQMGWIDQLLLDTQIAMHERALPTFVGVSAYGAARAKLELVAPEMLKAAVEPAPARRGRFRFLDRDYARTGRKQAPPPQLYGLRPSDHKGARAGVAAPLHVEAARNLSLALVTKVTKTQRAGIRKLVTESITKGIPPAQQGLRIANIVGLFPRWQNAVNNLHARMIQNRIPPHVADVRAKNYADELLEKRGIMIARTELLRAMNAGRWAGWHDLAHKGVLDPDSAVKQWKGTIDNRICPVCEYLADPMGDGRGGVQVVGLDTPFETEYGPVVMPPCHPHDRCSVDLIPGEVKVQQVSDGDLGEWVGVLKDPEMAAMVGVLA